MRTEEGLGRGGEAENKRVGEERRERWRKDEVEGNIVKAARRWTMGEIFCIDEGFTLEFTPNVSQVFNCLRRGGRKSGRNCLRK